MARRFLLLLATAVALAISCGGRNLDVGLGPESDDGGSDCPCDDGGGGGGGEGGLGGAGGGGEGGLGGEGGGGGFNPIDCIGCIATNCPEVLGCVTDPVCIQGIGCAVTQCLNGGEPDLMCVADCFGGDLEAALNALSVITCVFGECGDACGNLIPLPF
jgi:hypothetical protein